jgi:hypothetical protein
MTKDEVRVGGEYRVIPRWVYEEYLTGATAIYRGFNEQMAAHCGMPVIVETMHDTTAVSLIHLFSKERLTPGIWDVSMLVPMGDMKKGNIVKVINADGGQSADCLGKEYTIDSISVGDMMMLVGSGYNWGHKRVQLISKTKLNTETMEKPVNVSVPFIFVTENAASLDEKQRAFVKMHYDIFTEQISYERFMEFYGMICGTGKAQLKAKFPQLFAETDQLLGGVRRKELDELEVAFEKALGFSHHTKMIIASNSYSEGHPKLTDHSFYFPDSVEVIVHKRKGGGVLLGFKLKETK